LKDVTLRKVKCLRRPKIDIVKLNEMYSHPKGTGRREAAVVEGDNTENKLTAEIKTEKVWVDLFNIFFKRKSI